MGDLSTSCNGQKCPHHEFLAMSLDLSCCQSRHVLACHRDLARPSEASATGMMSSLSSYLSSLPSLSEGLPFRFVFTFFAGGKLDVFALFAAGKFGPAERLLANVVECDQGRDDTEFPQGISPSKVNDNKQNGVENLWCDCAPLPLPNSVVAPDKN